MQTTFTGKAANFYGEDDAAPLTEASAASASPGINSNPRAPGYIHKNVMRIPIKKSDFEDPSSDSDPIKAEGKGGLLSKLASKRKEANDDIVMVIMSRREYLQYWAKDKDGNFKDSVVGPPEGRKEWVRRQLEMNEEMKKDDPSLAKAPKEKFITKDKLSLGLGLSGSGFGGA